MRGLHILFGADCKGRAADANHRRAGHAARGAATAAGRRCVPALLLLVSALFTGCYRPTVNQRLDAADSMMWSAPDSALALLRTIPTARLYTARRQARHALLYSQALDRNRINTDQDSLIRLASDYYILQGTPDERLRAFYYEGRVHANAGDQLRAMACFTEAEACITPSVDQRMAGLLYTAISRQYNNTYSYPEALEAQQRAYEYYSKSGLQQHRDYAIYNIGDIYLNLLQYDKSDEALREAYRSAAAHGDTVLMTLCLGSMSVLHTDTEKWSEAKKRLSQIRDELHTEWDYTDKLRLAYIYSKEHNADSMSYYFEEARKSMTQNDSLIYQFYSYRINKTNGAYRSALEQMEEFTKRQNRLLRSALASPVAAVQRDFFQNRAERMSLRIREQRITTACVLFAMVLMLSGSLYLFYRKRREAAEYMERTNNRSSELVHRLFKEQFDLIERLGATYYERQNTPSEKEAIYGKVKAEIEKLGTDPKKQAALERIIDECNDRAVTRLREQLPQLKESDRLLFCYLVAGFSSRVISLFLQEKIENVYNRKSRLKSRISTSEAPDKELFLKLMN